VVRAALRLNGGSLSDTPGTIVPETRADLNQSPEGGDLKKGDMAPGCRRGLGAQDGTRGEIKIKSRIKIRR
jgi:hypothetical protein